ncbi:MAG: acyl carrier protein, partial [Candidatus Thiodiazotropha sp.]
DRIAGTLETVRTNIESFVREALHAEQESINAESSFLELGVDSITGVEIVRNVNNLFGLTLDAVTLYDYSTINAFARHVYENSRKLGSATIANIMRPAWKYTATDEKTEQDSPAVSPVSCGKEVVAGGDDVESSTDENLLGLLEQLQEGRISVEDAEQLI